MKKERKKEKKNCLSQGTILSVVMQHLIIQQKKGTKAQINPDHRRSQGARAPPPPNQNTTNDKNYNIA